MGPLQNLIVEQTRRNFLTTSACGIGAAALGSMLAGDGLISESYAAEEPRAETGDASDPLARKKPHFDGPAKSCIFIFNAGAPSHLDLFNPKPKLNELSGKPLPKSLLEEVRWFRLRGGHQTL